MSQQRKHIVSKVAPILAAAAAWALPGTAGLAAPGEAGRDSPAREEYCLLIEPNAGPQVVKPIPGSKLTGWVPGRETTVGVRYYTAREYEALGVSWEEFGRRAEAAASRQLARLKPEFSRDANGFVRYAVLKGTGHLTASSVLAAGFAELFRPTMGDELVLLIPDRFTVYVFPRSMGEYKEFGRKVLAAFEEAAYPVSYEVFLLNRQGLSCLGSFRTE
jgi:hypothetical protein